VNYLLFKNNEVQFVDNRPVITVSGSRACYIRDRHQLTTPGTSVKAAIYGGKLGYVKLCSVQDINTDNPSYIFEGEFDKEPPAKSNITLIVGVARPQTIKKVIQLAISYGVSKVEFLRMDKTIPSYCDSKIWIADSIENEIWESLEQVGDSIAVNITLNKDAHYFARAKFAEHILNFDKVIACDSEWTNSIVSFLDSSDQSNNEHIAIILGPEAGFSDRERQWLSSSAKILKSGLGKRIFRLEHAVGCALAICTARRSI
jgi:16S rRNA (uracil1498-N3)-methyltransferase